MTWNINKAAYVRNNLWQYIKQINFDIGLFQEVYIVPSELKRKFLVVRGEMLAILIKNRDGIIVEQSDFGLDYKKSFISDFFIACKIKIDKKQIEFINIYNYMGPSEKEFEQFLSVLYQHIKNKDNVIIGGDLNMNVNFRGNLANWGRVAQRMITRLKELDYANIQPLNKGNVFTYLTPNKKTKYQLDYLFIPNSFHVADIKIGNVDDIIFSKPRLSDHLPLSMEIKF